MKKTPKTIGQYKDYLTKLYTVLGYKNPEVAAQKVVDFEKLPSNFNPLMKKLEMLIFNTIRRRCQS